MIENDHLCTLNGDIRLDALLGRRALQIMTSLARTANAEALVDTVLPTGPRFRFYNTYRYATDYVGAMQRWHERWGPTFTLHDVAGTSVVTSDPELICELFAEGRSEVFAAGAPDTFDVLVGTRSLLHLPGAAHHQRRKLLNPAFSREAMGAWTDAVLEATRIELDVLPRQGRFVAVQATRRITLRVMTKLVFGALGERDEAIRETVLRLAANLHPRFLLVRGLQREWGGRSAFGRFMAASRTLDRLLLAQVAERRAAPHDSLLDRMIASVDEQGRALDDATLVDELRNLLFGGHETTARSLAWALDYLHRDPELLERTRRELAAVDEPAALLRHPLLAAIIDETLRIRPIAGQLFRVLARPLALGRWRLPAGVIVSPAPCLVHLRADLWPEPERFDPERFLNGHPRPGTFIPFGGGVHRCLGANLARFELALVLGTLLREYAFELVEAQPPAWVRDGLPLGPAGGVPLRLLGQA